MACWKTAGKLRYKPDRDPLHHKFEYKNITIMNFLYYLCIFALLKYIYDAD